jgi:glycerate dehydrogenase
MSLIVVLDGHTVNPGDNSWQELAQLGELVVHERTPRALLLERARGAAVVLTNKTVLDAELLAALPGLRGISVLATGYNVVDVQAARALGIAVSNVPSYSTESVVEHTFALLFELCRRVGQHDLRVHEGAWVKSEDFCFWDVPQRQLAGKCLGVIGYGNIGVRVARAAAAFGMRVLATPSRQYAPEAPVEVCSVEALAEQADVVSLHCPLNLSTQELVRWEFLTRMKPTAYLLNTARGGLVREADLARALHEGVIAGAALDVLSSEPPAQTNPLLSAPGCIITPHLAWTSIEARRRVVQVSVENVRGFLNGSPVNVVS